MIGKILGAVAGKKIVERYGNGPKGALMGAMAPVVARRAFGPLGLAVAGGWAAKKLYDHRKARRATTDYRGTRQY